MSSTSSNCSSAIRRASRSSAMPSSSRPSVGQVHAEVAPGVALDGPSVRDQRGHRDRLAGQRLGLLVPVGQHQHLRQPAQHGGPPPGRGLRGHQLHGPLVRRQRVLGVRRHPQVAAQPLVQPAVQVQVVGVHARDRLADQLGGAVGVRGQVGDLGRPVQQPGPRQVEERLGVRDDLDQLERPLVVGQRLGEGQRVAGLQGRGHRRRRAPGPGRRPRPSAGPAGRPRALPGRRARDPG